MIGTRNVVLAVLVVLAVAAGWSLFLRPGAQDADIGVEDFAGPPLREGAVVAIAGDRLPGEARNVLLFAGPECPYSMESVPFYAELARVAPAAGAALTVLNAGPASESERWLADHGIVVAAVRQVEDPMALGLLGTPTLIILGPDGAIQDLAVGRLSSAEEAQFLDRVRQVAGTRPVLKGQTEPELSEDEFRLAFSGETVQVLDIRRREDFARGHRPTAVNIPFDELATRAPAELLFDMPVVVDCSVGSLADCRSGATALTTFGFSRVAVLRPVTK